MPHHHAAMIKATAYPAVTRRRHPSDRRTDRATKETGPAARNRGMLRCFFVK
jgi:hypothetical protein